ncbi:hypothetical protein EV715DRAFT_215457, partial [Schizophyllum commune]
LLPYMESDTFLGRDAGLTWEEVHKRSAHTSLPLRVGVDPFKDAHLWELGDTGSVLVMANGKEPTDCVLCSTNEGKTWHEYKFVAGGKLRVCNWTDTSGF